MPISINAPHSDNTVLPKARVMELVEPFGIDGTRIDCTASSKKLTIAARDNEIPLVVLVPEGKVSHVRDEIRDRLEGRTTGDDSKKKLSDPIVTVHTRGNNTHFVDAGKAKHLLHEHGKAAVIGRDIGGRMGEVLHRVTETGKPVTPRARAYIPVELLKDLGYMEGLGQGFGNAAYTPLKEHLKVSPDERRKDGKPLAAEEMMKRALEVRQGLTTLDILNPQDAVKEDVEAALEALRSGENIAKYKAFARFLSELPSNILTTNLFVLIAKTLVEQLRKSFKLDESELSIEVYGSENNQRDELLTSKQTLESLEMRQLIAIHGGSRQAGPYFVRIKHRPKKAKENKNINSTAWKTMDFDDGGRANKLDKATHMKADMTAGANGLATLIAIVEEGIDKNFDFGFGVTSNENGQDARQIDDVERTAAGVVTEERHTDAEGRLSLADVVAVLERLTHDEGGELGEELTMATLTGAAFAANGHRLTVLSPDRNKARIISDAATDRGELATAGEIDWKDLEKMKGEITEVANIPKDRIARGHQTGGAYIFLASGASGGRMGRKTHIDIASGGLDKTPQHPQDLKTAELASGEGIVAALEWAKRVAV